MCIITSAATSINKINRIYKNYIFDENSTILDFGCGRYFYNTIKYLEKTYTDVAAYGYDPYNQSTYENNKTFEMFDSQYPDYIVCANVLNVINKDSELMKALELIHLFCGENTSVVFCLYEGDRSNEGRKTSKGWQRNCVTDWYIPSIGIYFEIIDKKKKILTCKAKERIGIRYEENRKD